MSIKVQFIGATAIEDTKFLELSGTSAEGIVYPLASGFDAKSQELPTKQFVETFKSKFNNEEPGWVESHCYDAFMLIVTAMKATNKTDGESIREYLDTMNIYKGVTGTIKFDKNGDISKKVIFKTVKNGQFVEL